MERMTGQLVKGGMDANKARKIAQDQAIQHDRRERDKR